VRQGSVTRGTKSGTIAVMRRLALVFVSLLAGAACDDSVDVISRTDLVINTPVDGASVFSLTPMSFSATATNPVGITSIALQAGSVVVQTCPNTSDLAFTCTTMVNLPDIAAQIQNGMLHLQATATDAKKLTKTTGINVTVTPILVSFTAPVASGSPPLATVTGTGPIALSVQSELPVTSVDVTTSTGLPVVGNLSAGGPYSATLDWPVQVGIGMFTLDAKATDTQGHTGTASLALQVNCATDADCSPQVCCVSRGTCVGAGATTCQ